LKKERPSLNNVYSQTLQNVAERIDKAFQNFFRRVKNGDKKVGYPRFKGFDQYDSLTYKQASFGWNIEDNKLKLSKIGSVKIKIHRSIIGTLKTCTIRRQAGKWYACFSVEYQNNPLPKSDKAVGIDVGLENFATLSTQENINNPRFFKTDQKALAKAQRKLSKQTKGSLERKRAKQIVVKIHEGISNRRHNFIHQEARKIVNRFGVICVEKLNIKDMMSNQIKVFGNRLNKSIADVAWSQFANVLSQKAEDAARQFVAIDPRGTSQRCSQCGSVVKKELSDRWHDCPVCNCHLHRDFNASLNILALGLESIGSIHRSP
jgi:putative transposase